MQTRVKHWCYSLCCASLFVAVRLPLLLSYMKVTPTPPPLPPPFTPLAIYGDSPRLRNGKSTSPVQQCPPQINKWRTLLESVGRRLPSTPPFSLSHAVRLCSESLTSYDICRFVLLFEYVALNLDCPNMVCFLFYSINEYF